MSAVLEQPDRTDAERRAMAYMLRDSSADMRIWEALQSCPYLLPELQANLLADYALDEGDVCHVGQVVTNAVERHVRSLPEFDARVQMEMER